MLTSSARTKLAPAWRLTEPLFGSGSTSSLNFFGLESGSGSAPASDSGVLGSGSAAGSTNFGASWSLGLSRLGALVVLPVTVVWASEN